MLLFQHLHPLATTHLLTHTTGQGFWWMLLCFGLLNGCGYACPFPCAPCSPPIRSRAYSTCLQGEGLAPSLRCPGGSVSIVKTSKEAIWSTAFAPLPDAPLGSDSHRRSCCLILNKVSRFGVRVGIARLGASVQVRVSLILSSIARPSQACYRPGVVAVATASAARAGTATSSSSFSAAALVELLLPTLPSFPAGHTWLCMCAQHCAKRALVCAIAA